METISEKKPFDQQEAQIIESCLTGDNAAFEKLFTQYRPQLFTYFLMRYADFYEAEDDAQEVLLNTYASIEEVPKNHFSAWIFDMASRFSQSKLKDKTPWSPNILEILQEQLMENPAHGKFLQEIYQDFEENYQISDHLFFCFIALSKTRFTEEQEIFLLSELFDFSPEELTQLQSWSSSGKKQIEIKLRETHEDLAELYAQRCSLIKRDASCTQCQDLGRWLQGEEKIEKQLEDFPLSYNEDTLESFDERLDLIRERLKQKMNSPKFHQKLFELLRLAIGEKGLEEE